MRTPQVEPSWDYGIITNVDPGRPPTVAKRPNGVDIVRALGDPRAATLIRRAIREATK